MQREMWQEEKTISKLTYKDHDRREQMKKLVCVCAKQSFYLGIKKVKLCFLQENGWKWRLY